MSQRIKRLFRVQFKAEGLSLEKLAERCLFAGVAVADLVDLLDTGFTDMCHNLPPNHLMYSKLHITI